jgi:hypothetical protein
MAFGFVAGRRAKMRKDRAQKVVLACATFDPDGKVMLTTDGVFPCREITDSYHERVPFPVCDAHVLIVSLSMIVSTPAILCFYGSFAPLSTGTQSVISFQECEIILKKMYL